MRRRVYASQTAAARAASHHGAYSRAVNRATRPAIPAQSGDFRPPQPAHEQEPGDHGVESAPALRRGVGFDAPAVRAGPFGGGENRGEPVRAQRGGLAPAPVGGRATVAAQHAGGRFPGGVWLAGELGPEVRGLDGLRGGAGGAARLEHVGEVGGQARVLQGAAGEPPIQGALEARHSRAGRSDGGEVAGRAFVACGATSRAVSPTSAARWCLNTSRASRPPHCRQPSATPVRPADAKQQSRPAPVTGHGPWYARPTRRHPSRAWSAASRSS